MKHLLFMLLFGFGLIVLPQCSIAQMVTPNACDQFKTPVIAPSDAATVKMPIVKPDEKLEAKGIVVNPCEQKILVVTPPRSQGKKAGVIPSSITNVLTPNGAVRPASQLLDAAQMLKKACAAMDAKEKK